MQTFLPYPDFADSAAALDSPRLGKQRVETLQILRALVLPEYGWRNHPAVVMWRGRVPALVCYGLTCVAEWTRRGFADSTAEQIAEFAVQTAELGQAELAAADLLPSWLGNPALHSSHRSRLVAKDPAFYRVSFPEADPGTDYLWPGADADRPAGPAAEGTGTAPLWVIRPESPEVLGLAVAGGYVGIGSVPGLDRDLTGLDPAALGQLVEPALRRKSGRALAGLAAFLGDIRPGDEVAVLIGHGQQLLVGEITGNHTFSTGRTRSSPDSAGPRHRRPVRWERVIGRSSVVPPASLQDVRPLFRVARA